MTAIVNEMDNQRWSCRTHMFQQNVFQFNGTSFEGEPKRIGRPLGGRPHSPRPTTSSSFARNFPHPTLAPP